MCCMQHDVHKFHSTCMCIRDLKLIFAFISFLVCGSMFFFTTPFQAKRRQFKLCQGGGMTLCIWGSKELPTLLVHEHALRKDIICTQLSLTVGSRNSSANITRKNIIYYWKEEEQHHSLKKSKKRFIELLYKQVHITLYLIDKPIM